MIIILSVCIVILFINLNLMKGAVNRNAIRANERTLEIEQLQEEVKALRELLR